VGATAAPALTGDEDGDVEVPDTIEEVIQMLLTAIRDKDTIVRYVFCSPRCALPHNKIAANITRAPFYISCI
jgi:hypothetical protein